ncbi:glycosyltransferase [Collimonas pratensis]|uniref:glycosyltransferase n=1 Tax=Collimonas pratensis TaxID=279113 RepID=UPI00143D844E|nr:glycosyltransferase [Collimonas pratensis]NKI70559.1 glycosyltransferase [Collimonas pratensis]
MNFILYSGIDESTISNSRGTPGCSYYLILKAFQSVLSELGTVHLIAHPETEIDSLFDAFQQRGEESVFLSFTPPHATSIDLKCPTIPVFTWEYSNIPYETWNEEARNDWRLVFARHNRAITLSNYAARAVKDAMGSNFPIIAIPLPVWERFARARECFGQVLPGAAADLLIPGQVIDSHVLGLSADGLIQHMPWPGSELQAETVQEESVPANAAQSETVAAEVLTDTVPQVEEAAEYVMPGSQQPEPAVPRRLRYRLAVTKRHMLGWYREALRDLLPLWLAKAIAISGRQGHALIRAALQMDAKPQDTPIVVPVFPEPEIKGEIPGPEPELVQEPVTEPVTEPLLPLRQLSMDGVIYTSVFDPMDGSKNWIDMLTAFCWTFRETEDATLVLKMNVADLSLYHTTLMTLLSQLAPFKCRVVTVHAYLDDATYEKLILASSYYVNTSVCEGLSLPPMEFMCCGKPVIAPRHTAMADYIDDGSAFIVKAGLEHCIWPQDPRDLFRTLRYRLDWESICLAFHNSYRVAKEAPDEYLRMGNHAMQRLESYCSAAVVKEQFRQFFQLQEGKQL